MPNYSSQCNPIAEKIRGLQSEVTSFQKSLHSAAPGAKAAIISQINRLNSEIASERRDLDDCVRKHPYHPPPPPKKNPCLGILKKVNKLQEELDIKIQKALAPLQKELQNAAPGAKAALVHQIAALRESINKNDPLAGRIAAKKKEYHHCIIANGGLTELSATFHGTATMYTDNSDAPGPYPSSVDIGLNFSSWDHAKVLVTSFAPISVTFDTPLGSNTTTVSMIGGSGTYDPDGYLRIVLDLYFHHSLDFAGDSRLHIVESNVTPMTEAGEIDVHGGSLFQDGYLDGSNCSIEVSGIISPHP